MLIQLTLKTHKDTYPQEQAITETLYKTLDTLTLREFDIRECHTELTLNL